MHNGVLWTLKEVVHFYNTRDVLPLCDPELGNTDPGFGTTCWAEPEIPETMDSSFLGNLNLTDDEEDAIVAFLETLTDGYTQP
jgi:cytochrome c peroxidase